MFRRSCVTSLAAALLTFGAGAQAQDQEKRSGTVVGAALGALFLGFISNALILLRLSQFWLQALYGVVILIAVALDAFLLRRFQRSATARRRR